MAPEPTTPTRDDRLDDVILAYLKGIEAGETPDRRQILARHPDLADDLIRFFANKDQLNPFNSTLLPPIPPEPSSETELRSFGDYEVHGKIGDGGMGEVYKVRQISLKRFVALKVILPDRAASAVDVQRFIQEAEDVAKLDHPHIVPIYEVNSHDGKPYFSMKLMEGGSLASRIGDYRLPLVDRNTGKDEKGKAWSSAQIRKRQREIADLMATIARAVHHAHQRGILHRDLKPANVLLDAEGKPHVTDFGLAKRIGGGGLSVRQGEAREGEAPAEPESQARQEPRPPYPNPEAAQATVNYTAPEVATLSVGGNAGLSASGTVAGTPPYMAPEQAAASKVLTTAVDVYGLGAILYELLTGRPPFRANTPVETLLQVIEKEPVKPSAINPRMNPDAEAICLRCLRKDPHGRYGSAEALAEDLGRFLQGEPIRARPVGPAERVWCWSRRNPYLAAAGSLAAAALISVAVVSSLFARHYFRAADDLREALDDVSTQRDRADERTVLAESRLAENYLDQGLAACALDNDPAKGMVQMVRALEFAPENNADLQWIIRTELAGWRREGHSLRSILSHTGEVVQAKFSPDGKTLLTVCTQGTARLWDVATGKPLGPCLENQSAHLSVAFSPDGNPMLAVSKDKTLRLWDAATGIALGPPLQDQDEVIAIAFSPDGKMVVTGSNNNTAQLWQVATGKSLGQSLRHGEPQVASFRGQVVGVGVVAFSPDSKFVLTSSFSDGTIRLWETATGKTLGPPLEHRGPVSSVAFSPDGKTVLTASLRSAQLREVATGKSLLPPLQHQDYVLTVAFSPDGKTLLTGSGDGARLWETSTGKALAPPLQHQGGVYAIVFSPDGEKVLTGSWDNTARLWEVATGKAIGAPLKHQGRVNAVAFSPDGNTVVTGAGDSTARLWDVATDKGLNARPRQIFGGHCVLSADGKSILTISGDNTGRLWDVATGKALGPPLERKDTFYAVALSPDGTMVVTGNFHLDITGRGGRSDYTAQLWEVATGKAIGPPMLHQGNVRVLAFSPDGKTVVTGSEDSKARLWEVATGKALGSPLQHESIVAAVAFSPNGTTVLTGSGDKTARLWEVATGKALGPPLRHQGPVLAVAFSPDGKTVLTGSGDTTARLWEAATGKALGPHLQHQGAVFRVAFSPNGKIPLTGSADGSRLWDVATRKAIGPPLDERSCGAAVAFSPDGKTVLIVGDQTVGMWEVPVPVEGDVERIKLWVEVLTGAELDDHGAVRVLDADTWQERRRRLDELGGPPLR